MGEPQHFRSHQKGMNWINQKSKEINWLMHKVNVAKTDEQREKASKKLLDWLDKHPLLAKEFYKKLFKEFPEIAEAISRKESEEGG